MKILAILLAAVAVAGAINPAAIYRSRCSEGTSYWCLGVAEADECGAVEYCIQDVWRGQSVQESPACSNCEAFVNGVRNVLEQTSVQEEILQGAKLACTVMGSLASTCENVVDTLGPELLKTLVTELTADKVCALLKFCPGSSLQSPNDDEICTVCKDFMSAANAMVSNATLQQEVEDTILALCPLLETFIPNCAETVKTDFPIIVQLLLTYLKPSTCVDLGVCTSNSPARQFIQKVMKIKSLRNVDESQLCSDCMTYVGDLDVFLSNSAIQEAVILELDQLCYTLGAPLSMLCKYAVNTYTKPIFAELVTVLNPQTFCPRIGFCPSLSLPKVSKMRPSLGDDCVDCEALIKDIDGMLMNQTVQNMIIQELDDLCEQLGTFSVQCKSYVDQYAELVFDTIASFLDPDQVCQTIGFCQSRIWNKLSQKLHSKAPGDTCSDCEAFIKDIDGLLTNTTVQHIIIEELDAFCSQLGSFAAQCKSYVDDFAPLVFSELATLLDPQTVCQGIGFCSSTTSLPRRMPFKFPQGPSKQCTDCGKFFTDVLSKLNDPTVQNDIVSAVEQVCSLMGDSADMCRDYVDQYGYQVVQFIVSSLDPSTICNDLGFCMSVHLPRVKQVTGPSKQCTDCGKFFTDVISKLNDPSVQSDIVSAVEQVCSLMGDSADMCRDYVDQYGYQVIQFIVSSLDPSTICNDLGFCMSVHLPRVKQKVTGPSKQCTDCGKFFTDVISKLNDPNVQGAIVNAVEQVCSLMGDSADMCRDYVDQYGYQVVQFIVSSLDPSTICNDLGFCMSSSLWKQVFKADPALCSDCKNLITDVDGMLSNQTVQQMILAELQTFCQYAGSYQLECKLLIQTYGPTVFQYLETALNPDTVCTEIGFCTSDAAPAQLSVPASSIQSAISLLAAQPVQPVKANRPKPPVMRVSDEDCDLCKIVMHLFAEVFNNNKTEEEILNDFEMVCNILPEAERQECRNYISTYGFLIIELLSQSLSPENICRELSFCSSSQSLHEPMKALKAVLSRLPKADTPFCSICQLFVQELDVILSSNKSKTEIVQEVEKLICDNLPSPLNTQCLSFMEIYGDVLVQLLLEQFNPKTFCAEVGLCDSSAAVAPVDRAVSADASTQCVICEFIMTELDELLAENATQEEIIAAVDKVCSLLPSTLRDECVTFVNTYGQEIIAALENELDPSKVCTTLGLCTSAVVESVSVECVTCEYVMSALDKLLDENSTKEEIIAAVDKVCSILPATVRDECVTLVNTYGPAIIAALEEKLDPKTICTTLGLCDSTKLAAPSSSPQCSVCELVVASVDTIVGQNKTQERIKAALEKACNVLPTVVQPVCRQFVNKFQTVLISAFLNMEPEQICSYLSLCDFQLKLKLSLGSVECDVCQDAVREFMNELQEPSVTKEIVSIINDTCEILPDNLKTECFTDVDQYGALVTQFIAQFFDPITTCTLIGACPTPANEPRKQLLGQHECSRGPGFWCASRENAMRCNMVEHCKLHVWN